MNVTKSCFELHDLLLLIGAEGRTGELVIESGNNIGSLLFHEGKILLAFSPYTKAIGDRLVEQGVINENELLEVLKQQLAGPPVPVGLLLMNSGKVTYSVLEELVQDQIRNAIRDFSVWSPVEFIFMKKDINPVDKIHLAVYEFIPREALTKVQLFAQKMPSEARSESS